MAPPKLSSVRDTVFCDGVGSEGRFSRPTTFTLLGVPTLEGATVVEGLGASSVEAFGASAEGRAPEEGPASSVAFACSGSLSVQK